MWQALVYLPVRFVKQERISSPITEQRYLPLSDICTVRRSEQFPSESLLSKRDVLPLYSFIWSSSFCFPPRCAWTWSSVSLTTHSTVMSLTFIWGTVKHRRITVLPISASTEVSGHCNAVGETQQIDFDPIQPLYPQQQNTNTVYLILNASEPKSPCHCTFKRAHARVITLSVKKSGTSSSWPHAQGTKIKRGVRGSFLWRFWVSGT